MSANWHYFYNMNKVPRVMIPKTGFAQLRDLYQFTGLKAERQESITTGRAWKAEELRLKSHDDLHKLWYVLLKEKNKLRSDKLQSIQLQQQFYGNNDMKKVKLSMARLLTVVNERQRLRNQYRQYLEDQYIKGKKEQERYAYLKSKGIEPESEEKKKERLEKKQQLKEKRESERKLRMKKEQEEDGGDEVEGKQHQRRSKSFAQLQERIEKAGEEEEAVVSPLLGEDDLKAAAQLMKRMPRKQLLKRYVKNYSELNERQQNQVVAKIQATRAQHAKDIFLKELAALGKKMNEQEEANVPDSRLKNQKDPLKLKLEQICSAE